MYVVIRVLKKISNSVNLFALAGGSYGEGFCMVCVLPYGTTNTANKVGLSLFFFFYIYINYVVNVSIRKNSMAYKVQSKTSP